MPTPKKQPKPTTTMRLQINFTSRADTIAFMKAHGFHNIAAALEAAEAKAQAQATTPTQEPTSE